MRGAAGGRVTRPCHMAEWHEMHIKPDAARRIDVPPAPLAFCPPCGLLSFSSPPPSVAPLPRILVFLRRGVYVVLPTCG
jgi:hypothetical protein